MQSKIVFSNIPHRFLNKQVRFTVTCRDFVGVDTVVTLSKNVILDVKRDSSVYGNVHFLLYDPDNETGVPSKSTQDNRLLEQVLPKSIEKNLHFLTIFAFEILGYGHCSNFNNCLFSDFRSSEKLSKTQRQER